MNILELAQRHGNFRKASSSKGGEYVGACPVCGGETRTTEQIRKGDLLPDRFHLWPHQTEYGTFWCRKCDRGGDAIQFLIEVEGMTYPEACRSLGKEITDHSDYGTPQPKKQPGSSWQPSTTTPPAELWQQHAAKFVEWSHQQLLAAGEGEGTPLQYLASRGIRKETAIKFRLGWNPGEKGKDLYRAREAWGLETIKKDDGKPKKLWLPIGLVIPFFVDGALRRARIRIPVERRTPSFTAAYYVVPGSGMDTFVTAAGARAWFIVEAELDAILIDQEAGDLAGCMAMGNCTARPTAAAFDLLQASLHIANALDYDLKEGSTENPGGVNWLWWKDHFTQAERWPVPVGKDPGDAWKAGVNLREWCTLGLPPVCSLPPQSRQTAPSAAPRQDDSPVSGSGSAVSEKQAGREPVVHTVTARDGRQINVTDDPLEYDRLAAAGKIVFNSKEIALVKSTGADPDQAARFLDIKELFPGTRVESVEQIQNLPETPAKRSSRYPNRSTTL